MALLSIRCGRAGGEPSVVIEGRAAWVRFLALGLLKANQSGSWRKKFRGLSYRLTEAKGDARAVVLGSLRRAKRREHVFQWLWRTIEGVLQQELNERAANYLRGYMADSDAETIARAVAKRTVRAARDKSVDADVMFARILGAALSQYIETRNKRAAEQAQRAAFARSLLKPRPAMQAAFTALAAGFRAS